MHKLAALTASVMILVLSTPALGKVHKPACMYQGTEKEGWYWEDTGKLITRAPCAKDPKVYCADIGTLHEGWVGTQLYVPAKCHRLVGIALENEPCINGRCMDGLECLRLKCPRCGDRCKRKPVHKPVCLYQGRPNEGWYWEDTLDLIIKVKCSKNPKVSCGAIGTRSESWSYMGARPPLYANCHRAVGIALQHEACGPMHKCRSGLYCSAAPYPAPSGWVVFGPKGPSQRCMPLGTCRVDADCYVPENNATLTRFKHPGYFACRNGRCVYEWWIPVRPKNRH